MTSSEVRTSSSQQASSQADEWLLDAKRSWQEVDDTLETRLASFQWGFQNPDSAPKLKQDYGLERKPNVGLARLLAYATEVDLCRIESSVFERAIAQEETLYQSKKQAIRQANGMRQKANQAVDLLGRQKEEKTKQYKKRGASAEAVRLLFLRKAVLEIFSIDEPHAKSSLESPNLPQLLHEAQQNLTHYGVNEELKERQPVTQFIRSLADYLSTTTDSGLLQRYHYRHSPIIIGSIRDCEHINSALEFVLNSAQLTTSAELKDLLQKLGHSHLRFLVRHSDFLSVNKNTQEPYPHLSLLYDLYAVSFFNGNTNLLQGISGLVDEYLRPRIEKSNIVTQCKLLDNNEFEAMSQSHYCFFSDPELSRLSPGDRNVLEYLPHKIVGYVSGIEYRLGRGLANLPKLLSVYGLRSSHVLNFVNDSIHKFETKHASPPWISQFKSSGDAALSMGRAEEYLQNLMLASDLYIRLGIEVDLYKIYSFYTNQPTEIPGNQRISLKDFYHQRIPHYKHPSARNNALFAVYLKRYWEDQI